VAQNDLVGRLNVTIERIDYQAGSVKGKPIILASLGCFFDHLSYSLRTARLVGSKPLIWKRSAWRA
jgi:hypothetical protein